jgi:4-hydroxy-tetrahydrodipicolinate reductase
MIRVAVCGASGRTGRLVTAEVLRHPALTLAAAWCRPDSAHRGVDVGSLLGMGPAGIVLAPTGTDAGIDVVIDFSSPAGLRGLLPTLGDAALVTGTTGLDDADRRALDERATRGAVLAASNFSTGVAVLLHLARAAARALPDYDVEIVEVHHRHKVDAPSGTALSLAGAVADARQVRLDDVARHGRHGAAGPRPAGEIGLHAVRGGGVVGDHEVALIGDTERIVLGHTALTRAAFATGAARAAAWIAGKPAGTYRLDDVLGLTSP